MTIWISETSVRIEPAEMSKDEAIALAKEMLRLLYAHPKKMRWTKDQDNQLAILRQDGRKIREMAIAIFGDPQRVSAIYARIRHLNLPISEGNRQRGLAGAERRWRKVSA